jgi:hypothetical protein
MTQPDDVQRPRGMETNRYKNGFDFTEDAPTPPGP